MLIEIDDKIVTDELFSRKFVCDLSKCKGACCVEGDAGAPLKNDEIKIIERLLPKIKPYMTEEGIAKVEKDGVSYRSEERRVGKECRSRWWSGGEKRKKRW